MTPEQLAAYFNDGWFERQLAAWLGTTPEAQEYPYGVWVSFKLLAAHLAGNLAQAAMGLEKEAANG